jgi:hypothetical protein
MNFYNFMNIVMLSVLFSMFLICVIGCIKPTDTLRKMLFSLSQSLLPIFGLYVVSIVTVLF